MFGTDGTLYAASLNSTPLLTANPPTGARASLGVTGFGSGGELAFFAGELYLASGLGSAFGQSFFTESGATTVPEPVPLALFGLGLAGLGVAVGRGRCPA